MTRATRWAGDEFFNYYDCFLGMKNDKLYFMFKFENFSDNLSYKFDNDFNKGYYFANLIKNKDRLKVYRNLIIALETIHEKGYVHRNIYPGNILTNYPLKNFNNDNKNKYTFKFSDYSKFKKISIDRDTYLSARYVHPAYLLE